MGKIHSREELDNRKKDASIIEMFDHIMLGLRFLDSHEEYQKFGDVLASHMQDMMKTLNTFIDEQIDAIVNSTDESGEELSPEMGREMHDESRLSE